jgi:hypothetical protein
LKVNSLTCVVDEAYSKRAFVSINIEFINGYILASNKLELMYELVS